MGIFTEITGIFTITRITGIFVEKWTKFDKL